MSGRERSDSQAQGTSGNRWDDVSRSPDPWQEAYPIVPYNRRTREQDPNQGRNAPVEPYYPQGRPRTEPIYPDYRYPQPQRVPDWYPSHEPRSPGNQGELPQWVPQIPVPDSTQPKNPNPVVPDIPPQNPYFPTEPIPARPAPLVAPPGKVVIPTLDRRKDSQDQSLYDANSPNARLYEQARDAIVKIEVDKTVDGQKKTGSGSGFFVGVDGKLATAYHVIQDAESIRVITTSGKRYTAKVTDVRPTTDVAVLQLENVAGGEKFKALPMGSSAAMKPNDRAYVVGHPAGWDPTFLSVGTLRAQDTQYQVPNLRDHTAHNPDRMLLDLDVLVLRGNSGSPVLNNKGEVVGVVNFGDDNGKSYAAISEDLNKILKRDTSWTAPSEFYFGSRASSAASIAGPVALAAVTSRFSPKMALGMSIPLGGLSVFVGGTSLIEKDLEFFNTALRTGSPQEQFGAGVNVGADASMVVGGFLTLGGAAFGSARVRTAGLILTGAGSLTKFLNTSLVRRGL